ncbi:hypothetical protein J4449_04040 [Candidatus Woesearchaeota archaeon]|nr:hypothetical protein [Candidatus Woesearchaeota archaeon]
METITKARKIGGSIAVIVPEEVVKKENIKPNDMVKIDIVREDDLSFLWGKLKSIKMSTQEIMEIIDEGEKD